jgi:hypothetical protein
VKIVGELLMHLVGDVLNVINWYASQIVGIKKWDIVILVPRHFFQGKSLQQINRYRKIHRLSIKKIALVAFIAGKSLNFQ